MKSFFPENKVKLSKFLLDLYAGQLSYSQFCKLLRKKDIKVDGKRVSSDVTLFGGEKVEVYYDGNENVRFYDVMFEDDNVLIIYKYKGITSESLYELLLKTYDGLLFCHRLDRNTDGIIIFAKNKTAYDELLTGFKKRTFEKYYIAKVYGTFEKKSDVLTAYLTKDEKAGLVRISDKMTEGAKQIKTGFTVVEQSDGCSVLIVRLFTGRTHQIRAHLAHIGHFVIGDGKYGAEKINRQFGANKLCLTAAKITLRFEKGDYLSYLDGKTFVIESAKRFFPDGEKNN